MRAVGIVGMGQRKMVDGLLHLIWPTARPPSSSLWFGVYFAALIETTEIAYGASRPAANIPRVQHMR